MDHHLEGTELTEKSPPAKKRKQLKTIPQVSERTVATRSFTKKADKARFDQFLEGTQIHPLLIDHVVDTIIEYALWPISTFPYPAPYSKSRDLCNIRLVCKQWSEQGAKIYRNNRDRDIEFGGEPFVQRYVHPFDLKMEKFLNDMYYCRAMPVQRYFFDATFFTRENYSMFKKFMLHFGPTIYELQLFFDHRSTMKFDRESFANLNLSGLKMLLIDLGGLLGYPYLLQRTHDTLVEVILKAAPILDRFWFRIPERETTVDAEVCLRSQGATFQRLREAILKNVSKTVTVLYMEIPVIQ